MASKILKNVQSPENEMHPIFRQICKDLQKPQQIIRTSTEQTCLFFLDTDIEVYGHVSETTLNICRTNKFQIPDKYNKFINAEI